jgi:hypothetical protein
MERAMRPYALLRLRQLGDAPVACDADEGSCSREARGAAEIAPHDAAGGCRY